MVKVLTVDDEPCGKRGHSLGFPQLGNAGNAKIACQGHEPRLCLQREGLLERERGSSLCYGCVRAPGRAPDKSSSGKLLPHVLAALTLIQPRKSADVNARCAAIDGIRA